MEVKKMSSNVTHALAVFNEVNLDQVLEVAEMVAGFAPVPGLPVVIKVLRMLIKTQNVSRKVTPAAVGLLENVQQVQVAATAQPSTSTANADNAARIAFNNLLDIALQDGVVTPEERQFLLPRAQKAGYTEEEFDLLILQKQQ